MVLTGPVGAGRHTGQFVYGHGAGRQLAGPREQFAQVGFALADPVRKDFRTADQLEVSVAFRGDRLGQERLAVARRTIQENTALRLDPQRLKVRSVWLKGWNGRISLEFGAWDFGSEGCVRICGSPGEQSLPRPGPFPSPTYRLGSAAYSFKRFSSLD